ncbi:hypothetical protein CVT26_012620 [Gymnopilus dilepis]|uniref:Uncharacterized protein n=1 Tax=Gymnopilus dilepis TaxID=231916 RepID=A0A409YW24_9AGAR|nr:hypothetical protein CVT26_012620 [Gymnopilus dilepis]
MPGDSYRRRDLELPSTFQHDPPPATRRRQALPLTRTGRVFFTWEVGVHYQPLSSLDTLKHDLHKSTFAAAILRLARTRRRADGSVHGSSSRIYRARSTRKAPPQAPATPRSSLSPF